MVGAILLFIWVDGKNIFFEIEEDIIFWLTLSLTDLTDCQLQISVIVE